MKKRLSLVFVCLQMVVTAVSAVDGAWNVDSNGVWSAASNWLSGVVPGGAGSTVLFTNVVTAQRTVEVDQPVTAGHLRFSSPANNNWKLTGEGPLNLDKDGAIPVLQSTVNQRVEIQAPLTGTDGFEQYSNGDIELSGVNSGLTGIMKLGAFTFFQTMSKTAGSAASMVQNQFPTSGVIMAGARLELYGRKNAGAAASDWILTSGSSRLAAFNGASTASLAPGQIVSGTGVPADTYVKAIVDGSSLVLSAAAVQSVTTTLSFAVGSFDSKQLIQRLRTDSEQSLEIHRNGGSSFEVEVERLHGSDDLLLQDSDGVLKIAGQRNHNASIKYQSGTLAVAPKSAAPRVPAADPVFHVDASDATTLTLVNGNEVSQWADVRGNGWVAKSGGTRPHLLANELNGLPVVDFSTWGSGQFMHWYLNDVQSSIPDIRTSFIVIGSQNGGAHLLSDPSANHFHRGTCINMVNDYRPQFASSKILGVGGVNGNTDWSASFNTGDVALFIDGVPARPEDSFSGGYQLVCLRTTKDGQAGSFANDRGFVGRQGGQRLAEVIIYDRQLTELERLETEEYLMAKWFPERWDLDGGSPEIRNLDATGSRVLSTPESGAVTLRKLSGGNTLTKNGGSTLNILDAQEFAGTLVLGGGNIGFDVAKIPSEPAADAYFHVDASVTNSFVLDGSGAVITWNDVRGNGLSATVPPGYSSPSLVVDGLHGGSFVDFGNGGSFKSLAWNHTNNAVRAAFLVFESRSTEAFLLGHHANYDFHRGGAQLYSYNDASRAVLCGLNAVNGHVVDGRYAVVPDGFNVYSVLAGTPGARASWFANDRGVAARTGGQRLAEAIIYNRELTDQERRDTEAYLMYKWLNRSAPGYGAAGAPLVGKVVVQNTGVDIAVAGEGTAAIGELSGVAGSINKSGSGTLAFTAGASGFNGIVNVEEGAVSSVVPHDSAPAAGAVFHVDASRTNTFTFTNVNGTNFITAWNSIGNEANTAVQRGSFPIPYLRTNDLSNLPVVDFGNYGSAGACLQFSRISDIRSVFWVIGSQKGGGFLLGDTDYADFHRGGNNIDGGIVIGNPMFGWNWSSYIQNGRVFLDGNPVANPAAQTLSGGWQLIEVLATGNTRANLLAGDRYFSARQGGQRLAEVIVYDRLLSETERLQTEKYLYKKWFGVTKAGAGLATVVVADGSGLEADAVPMTVNRLIGDADIIKTGGDVLTLTDTSSFTGVVEVAEGTLNLAVPAAPLLPPSNTIFWVDASAPGTMLFDSTGGVTNWSDVTGNGRYAYPTASGREPKLLGTDFAGMPVVDFGPYGTAGDSMYWNQRISGMKTVIWVLGSQASGGFLLGNTDVARFHRGPPPEGGGITVATMSNRSYIFGWDGVSPTAAYVDGVTVNTRATGLSGDYQILIFTYSSGNYADGFAFDRTFGDRHGGQRLAEFIVYDRVLTTGEILAADAYLRAKWLGTVNPGYAAPATDTGVLLHEGTLLTMNGTEQSVSLLAGAGAVSNGTLVVTELLAPGVAAGETATVPVGGNLRLGEGVVCEVDWNDPEGDLVAVSGVLTVSGTGSIDLAVAGAAGAASIPIFTFGSIEGAVNLAGWSVSGVPAGYTGRVTVQGNTVYVKINAGGTLILLR